MEKQSSPVRLAARVAAQQARAEVFRMRARELGGVNERTRPIIEAEQAAAAQEAAENVYLAAGYHRCIHAPACPRLASPSYAECPVH